MKIHRVVMIIDEDLRNGIIEINEDLKKIIEGCPDIPLNFKAGGFTVKIINNKLIEKEMNDAASGRNNITKTE